MSSQTPPVRPPGPGFDRSIPPGGYCWWHVEAESEDGRHGITLAAFLGSPVLGRAADPLDHCALLVSLRGAARPRWSMMVRGGEEVRRWPEAVIIGLNAILWSGDTLSFGIDDLAAPWPARLRGTVQVHLPKLPECRIPLDAAGRHRWRPLATRARVRVEMQRPETVWEGHGWVDAQDGDVPLDQTFRSWSRSRARLGEGVLVQHEFRRVDTASERLARRIGPDGSVETCEALQSVALPRTLWRLPRHVPADVGQGARVIRTLADTPLYARTLAEAPLFGATTPILHEALSLGRLRRGWGRLLLSLRSPPAWT